MSGTILALAMAIADPVIAGAGPAPGLVQAEPAPAETIQTETDRDDRMTVNVAVQGVGPYRFVIDTGSQRTVLSTALAGTLGLVQGPLVRVVGIAGSGHVATAQVGSIGVGTRSVHDLTVPLLEGRHIGADGILGTDTLQHQRVLFDFTRGTIRVGDPQDLGGRKDFEIVVRAKRRMGRLILTNARIDGVNVDVIIDTGANGTIGNLALQRAIAERKQGHGTVTSVTGHVIPVEFGLARQLELRGMVLGNVYIAFADAPAFEELRLNRRPAIFLGMRELRAFKRIAIDFSTRKVLFDLPG